MFGMYVCDNFSLKRFFQLILCQMYHILVIEITSKSILYKSVYNLDHVTDTWFMDGEEKRAKIISNWLRHPLGRV